MKIFFLEDVPEMLYIIENQRESGHEVYHAKNLQEAAMILEIHPGANYFDLFFFDLGLRAEKVKHIGEKGEIIYNHPGELNGLLFLLNNMDILGDKTKQISIISAYRKQITELRKLEIDGKIFKCISNFADEDRDATWLEYLTYIDESTNKKYDISYLDKGNNDIALLIKKFIHRR